MRDSQDDRVLTKELSAIIKTSISDITQITPADVRCNSLGLEGDEQADLSAHGGLEQAVVERITSFMTANPNGFASLEEAADAISAYYPERPRPKDLSGLKKNLRQGDDGRWRWHWDPSWMQSPRGDPRFLLKMMLRGRAVIPVEGHGMIGAWTAARVRQLGGEVRTACAVTELVAAADDRGRVTGVRLADGAELVADAVIVACGAEPARHLLGELDRQAARALDLRPRGVTTLAYRLGASFHTGRTIVLNAAPRVGDEPRVDLVCQESNLLRPGMGEGSRLLATCVHGAPGEPDPEALAQAMARMAAAWNPGYPWRDMATLEEVVVHPWAQFAVPPGVRDDLPDAATGLANVFLAGDFTAHPSIEGAVGSGERAADVAAMAVQRAVASGGH